MIVQLLNSHQGVWSVWVSLQGDAPTEPESFCIGEENNPHGAFEAAVRALNKALDDVVVLAHDRGVTVQR